MNSMRSSLLSTFIYTNKTSKDTDVLHLVLIWNSVIKSAKSVIKFIL